MDPKGANDFACSVCGMETRRHSGWFLVAENHWLDRIKVLSWHPVLARQPAMRSACCAEHLKTLLMHWLTHANLQLLAGGGEMWRESDHELAAESDGVNQSVGKLVGELAVHRESLSRAWTGSAESLECILNALISGVGNVRGPSQVPIPTLEQSPPQYAVPTSRA